jgi:DNA-binding transcriptional MerR regulator
MAPVIDEDVLLERSGVARVLDVSVSTVRRLEAAGILEPTIALPSGLKLFARFDAERIKRARAIRKAIA